MYRKQSILTHSNGTAAPSRKSFPAHSEVFYMYMQHCAQYLQVFVRDAPCAPHEQWNHALRQKWIVCSCLRALIPQGSWQGNQNKRQHPSI